MALNWIRVEDYPFECILMMERFQLRLMLDVEDRNFLSSLGLALAAHPAVKWYVEHKCPERAARLKDIMAGASEAGADVRAAELRVLSQIEDFVLYTTPERMDAQCDFIYAWSPGRLTEMADFAGKRVLDVGAGSGRLGFAVAHLAQEVYLSEPVDTLREYLRDKIARLGLTNVRVCDGMAHSLPFPDDCFDIVMSGHVVGDHPDEELSELTRVAKPGGWILDCPGEDPRPGRPNPEYLKRGFEQMHYVSCLGGDVYRYRKRVD